MANGASRIFGIMKNTSNNDSSNGQYIKLAVKTLNPLTFTLDDRIVITSDFYQLDQNFNKNVLSVGSKVNAIVLNDSQVYYILGNVNYQTNIDLLIQEINDLKRRVKALEDAQ